MKQLNIPDKPLQNHIHWASHKIPALQAICRQSSWVGYMQCWWTQPASNTEEPTNKFKLNVMIGIEGTSNKRDRKQRTHLSRFTTTSITCHHHDLVLLNSFNDLLFILVHRKILLVFTNLHQLGKLVTIAVLVNFSGQPPVNSYNSNYYYTHWSNDLKINSPFDRITQNRRLLTEHLCILG